jgi:hypothetical protein
VIFTLAGLELGSTLFTSPRFTGTLAKWSGSPAAARLQIVHDTPPPWRPWRSWPIRRR